MTEAGRLGRSGIWRDALIDALVAHDSPAEVAGQLGQP